MGKSDDEYDKQFDLEPSEYSYQGKHEPAFGPNALPMLITFLLSFPISAIVVRVIYGEFPYWVRPFLE